MNNNINFGQKFEQIKKKQLAIFFAIAFGLSFAMGLGIYFGKKLGMDINAFANFHMMTPALGVIVAMMVTRKDDSRLPKASFTIYIIISVLMAIVAWIPFLIPDFQAAMASNYILILGSILFLLGLFKDKKEKRLAFNLNLGHVKKILAMVGLFMVLYFIRMGVVTLYTEGMDTLMGYFTPMKLIFIPIIIINGFLSYLPFLGEEYGWRYFLQPICQKKFGMLRGLVVLGLLWGFWHLPLNLFYYSAEGTGHLSLINQLVLCVSYSMFFAFAYSYSGSIWTAVIIHYLNNNMILFFVDLNDLANLADVLQNQEYTWDLLAVMAVANLIFFGVFALAKRNRVQEYRVPTPEERLEFDETSLASEEGEVEDEEIS